MFTRTHLPIETFDVVLIGGGIMSATLGAILAKLLPGKSIALFERLDRLAGESSDPWNNAGTGHAGLCELNYMPDAADLTKPEDIARQFRVSQSFWTSLIANGELSPSFINETPHLNIVFGDRDVEYLRQRYETLRTSPLFSGMQYSEDAEVIEQWVPLIMAGRVLDGPVAATRHTGGTDVDFGSLTVSLADSMVRGGGRVHLGREVTDLDRRVDGTWLVSGKNVHSKKRFCVQANFVFVGAGGYALKLLQKSGIPEVRGYGVFPFGAEFLRTDVPEVVSRHDAKVYGQSVLGAPPMSLPHLDSRVVDGKRSLMFGPYATFSTKLLKAGSVRDLFTTVRSHNLLPLLTVGLCNLPLVRYLFGQLLATRREKFELLRMFVPEANPAQWYPIQAGQRAQLIKPQPSGTRIAKSGVLTFGTELITGAGGTIAGLLGASPGASVAPSIMIELVSKCFPARAAAAQAWAQPGHFS
ncbi:malate dehydrogenase (quinone) [Rhodococcus sp. 1168]|uniref:malate dehydrogenase (quinone) n=1 Tax=Rhodococcus sp. 1168 TaxID=2018041 RepID=UPI000A0AA03A|nr:malate dehydrogenase (quinone) [Rhodococcus sp. 1168]ORI12668.1 malate dehydrogenase (acceptor) [Rhodococcus sp. 1168]